MRANHSITILFHRYVIFEPVWVRCFCHYLIWKQGKSSAVYTEEKCIRLYDVIVAILSGIHTWLLHLFCIESTIKTNFWPYINQTFFQNLWAGELKFLGLWPEVSPYEWSFYSFMFLFGGGNKLPYRLMQYFDSKQLTLQNCKKKKKKLWADKTEVELQY